MLVDILKMTKENNQMLHAQRRSAFFWGFMKFLVYMILFAAPIWFYLTYVSGTLDQMVTAVNRLQGAPEQAQNKFEGFEHIIKNLQSKLPSFMQPHNNDQTPSIAP